jgi:hypothetical protein
MPLRKCRPGYQTQSSLCSDSVRKRREGAVALPERDVLPRCDDFTQAQVLQIVPDRIQVSNADVDFRTTKVASLTRRVLTRSQAGWTNYRCCRE